MRRRSKFMILAVLLLPVMLLTGCSGGNQDYYEQAQLYLGSGDPETAGMIFQQLGEYGDSAEYVLYCAALSALREGEYALARANWMMLGDFKSSRRYVAYLDAAALEEAGEAELALAAFEALGTFSDSRQRADKLREKIPEDKLAHARSLMNVGCYEQAIAELQTLKGWDESIDLIRVCEQALQQAAYDRAEALYAAGQYEAALTAFEALGDTLDAAARALACRSAAYSALEEDYQRAVLSTAEELMTRYAALDGYLDSEQRIASLEKRFRIGLKLRAGEADRSCVAFGRYPWTEAGLPDDLIWQVLAVEGDEAVLMCTCVIDLSEALPELVLTDKEKAALQQLMLPSADQARDVGSVCSATPYALAQGVEHETDGRGWWRLDDGRLMSAGGCVVETDAEVKAGVRPVIRISLEDSLWTSGGGTWGDPFR